MRSVRRSLLVVLSGLAVLCLPACRAEAPGQGIPAAKSRLIGQFVWQEDGDNACALLRPAEWSASGGTGGRVYTPPNQPDGSTVSLTLVNCRIAGAGPEVVAREGTGGAAIAQWEAFRQSPTLEGWTQAMEESWRRGMLIVFRLEESLERGKVYSLRPVSSASGEVALAAYVVDGGEPLMLVLLARGELADVVRLRQDGLYDDLLTMARSLKAIPEKPGYSRPPWSAG